MSFLLLLLIGFSERNNTPSRYKFDTIYKLEQIDFHLYQVYETGGTHQRGWQIEYGDFLLGMGSGWEGPKDFIYIFWYDLDRKHHCVVFEDPRKRE